MTAAHQVIHPLGPRERAMQAGVDSLHDVDLMAVLIGTGFAGTPVSALAGRVLDRFGGIEGVARLGPAALARAPGLGEAKALRILAAIELGRRSCVPQPRFLEVFRNSQDVAGWADPRIGPLPHEEMWMLVVDGRNRFRSARRVAQGGLHGCSLKPRDVLRVAIAESAYAFILVHNHPSGDPTPSPDDIAMTHAIIAAGAACGIPLLDHVVVAPPYGYSSLLDMGALEKR